MNIEEIKEDLLQRQAELQQRHERTHKHIYEKDEPVSANFSEQAKETENDQLVMTLEADAIEELRQIGRALERIEQGDYEECASCGAAISAERLQAIPYTDCCIRCAG